MDTSSLTPLSGRWLNDYFNDPTITLADATNSFGKLLDATSPSIYNELLVIDAADKVHVQAFAATNNMAYYERSNENLSLISGRGGWKHGPAWTEMTNAYLMPILAHVLSGKLHGYPITFSALYAGDGETNSDQGETYIRKKGIIRVTLPKLFPQILLDSNKNDHAGISSVATSYKSDQRITLEGDFPQYFDFFSPAGLQANTLTVLAPNFMQILVESSSTFDVEFFGNEMILTTPDPLFSPLVMDEALNALQAQLAYLDRLLVSWNYMPNNQPFDMLERSFVSGNVIKIGSLRIQPWVIFVLVLLLFFGIFIFSIVAGSVSTSSSL